LDFAGFGILQLFNSNEGTMKMTYNEYKKYVNRRNRKGNFVNGCVSYNVSHIYMCVEAGALPTERPPANTEMTYLWRQRRPHQHLAFWSTCAFLIDRVVMKPIVDRILSPITSVPSTTTLVTPNAAQHDRQKYSVRIIAGLKHPCTPVASPCCVLNFSTPEARNSPSGFITIPPCVFAPLGYQADSYIYAMAATSVPEMQPNGPAAVYVLTIPLITNGIGGNESTFHQVTS
jgi:hypothetical protein